MQKKRCSSCGYPDAKMRRCEHPHYTEPSQTPYTIYAGPGPREEQQSRKTLNSRLCGAHALSHPSGVRSSPSESKISPPEFTLSGPFVRFTPFTSRATTLSRYSPAHSIPLSPSVNMHEKAKRRRTQGTGRMRYMKTIPRRFKNGFREGTTAKPKSKPAPASN